MTISLFVKIVRYFVFPDHIRCTRNYPSFSGPKMDSIPQTERAPVTSRDLYRDPAKLETSNPNLEGIMANGHTCILTCSRMRHS